jgi:pimeloyl-ACP methyl ester carboxylesterase
MAGATLFVLWALWVRWVYRVRVPAPVQLRARCADAWEIAIYHRPAQPRRFVEPLLLCHGLAANHFNFEFEPPYSLAHSLSAAGFECFTVELRGGRASRCPPRGRGRWSFCADDYVSLDAPALIQTALRKAGARGAFWIGHSLGGLIGLAAAQTDQAQHLRGLLTLGAPVFFGYNRWLQAALKVGALAAWPFAFRQELLSSALAPFLGYAVLPFTDVIANPRHVPPRIQRRVYAQLVTSVSRKLLLQLRDWTSQDVFRSVDQRIDYRAGVSALRLPLLMLGGSRDRLCPPDAIRRAFELSRSADKTMMIFGCDNGDRQEYGHGDLVFGEGAPAEVYPRMATWLAERATPLEADREFASALR